MPINDLYCATDLLLHCVLENLSIFTLSRFGQEHCWITTNLKRDEKLPGNATVLSPTETEADRGQTTPVRQNLGMVEFEFLVLV